jgi:murein endopeptidase
MTAQPTAQSETHALVEELLPALDGRWTHTGELDLRALTRALFEHAPTGAVRRLRERGRNGDDFYARELAPSWEGLTREQRAARLERLAELALMAGGAGQLPEDAPDAVLDVAAAVQIKVPLLAWAYDASYGYLARVLREPAPAAVPVPVPPEVRPRAGAVLALTLLAACVAGSAGLVELFEAPAEEEPAQARPQVARETRAAASGGEPEIRWRKSRPVGGPYAGRLVRGVQLPPEGRDHFTWSFVRQSKPNPGWRRWGTDRLLRFTLRVIRRYRVAHPSAPRVGVADLSRRGGGSFGPEVAGNLGHASHQNGLDIDILYPRRDERERQPGSPGKIDRRLSQDLVNRFVRAGAEKVYIGAATGLTGRRGVVEILAFHDDHMHIRIPGPAKPGEPGNTPPPGGTPAQRVQ